MRISREKKNNKKQEYPKRKILKKKKIDLINTKNSNVGLNADVPGESGADNFSEKRKNKSTQTQNNFKNVFKNKTTILEVMKSKN